MLTHTGEHPEPLTDDHLRQLAAAAATLFERLSWTPSSPGEVDEGQAEETLTLWARRYAAGDRPALVRRLSWENLDEDQVARALTSPGPPRAASWTRWLPLFLEAARECAREWRTDGRIEGVPPTPAVAEPPFVEVWTPFVRVARAELEAKAGPALARVEPQAREALERQLARELAGVGELALEQRFSSQHEPTDHGQTGRYSRFIAGLLAGELETVFDEYPVLARQWTRLVETWVDSTTRMLQRLAADRGRIAEALGAGDPGNLTNAVTGLSDRHDGGHRVAVLELASGLRVVYKPRDVRLESALTGFGRWCARNGLQPAPHAPRVLARDGYGWVEAVSQCHLPDRRAAEGYFGAAGSLLCLMHILGARDLHGENIIATRTGPVVVDAEVLLAPLRSDEIEATGAGSHGSAWERESCLQTDLLSHILLDPQDVPYDIGGLQPCPTRATEVPRRQWHGQRSDGLHFTREKTVHVQLSNQPLLNGVPQRAERYSEALRSGFVAAYGFLLERRQELLAPDGPLSAFRDCVARALFRPSGQYAALLYVTCSPRYQRHGVDSSLALESLNNVFARELDRPRLWPLTHDERRALEGLDLPRFSVVTTDTAMRAANGTLVEGVFAESGFEGVTRRLRGQSKEDLAWQLEQLDAALSVETNGSGTATGPPSLDGGSSTLVDAAVLLGRHLLDHATTMGNELTWRACEGRHDLYDGVSGPALFLAALGAVTGEDAWRDAALAAARPLEPSASTSEAAAAARVAGICRGPGSVTYALTLMARAFGLPELHEPAARTARTITRESIAKTREYEVAGGLAGTLLALLARHSAGGEELERARECAERLLAGQRESGSDSAGWPGGDGHARAGLAHGAAGVAHALVRLHAVAPDPRLLSAARRGLRHERLLFSPSERNWPALTSTGSRLPMLGWCHGAPGVGLARALVRDHVSDAELDEELGVAVATTAEGPPSHYDDLCCGALGRCEALLCIGTLLGNEKLRDAARSATDEVARRVLRHGRLGLRTVGFETRRFHPGFFQGLSGVGYQFLRAARPEAVPSVLAFEPGGGKDA